MFEIAAGQPRQSAADLLKSLDPFGDVNDELHHLQHLAGGVNDGIVGPLDDDLAASFSDTLKLRRHEFAPRQGFPVFRVVRTVPVGRLTEYSMVPALHFIERVAHGVEEVTIGVDDRPIGRELDHGLVAAKGCDLGGVVDVLQARGGVGPLHDEADPAVALHQRGHQQIEGPRANPDGRAMPCSQTGEHISLMRRVFVKDVDIAADQVVDAEAREFLPQVGFRLLQKVPHGRI